jgi:chemotaxis protein CheX
MMKAAAGATIGTGRFVQHLDRAVDEVFSTMLGEHCLPVEGNASLERETVSAVIGLAGALSGSMVLHSGSHTAISMAARLTGSAPEAADAMVRDAVGEICNMIAGAWKGFDAVLSSGCLLSTPTVVAGSSYEMFSERAPLRIERCYRFADSLFSVTIFCERSA